MSKKNLKQITEEVDNGTYNVSTDELADKVLEKNPTLEVPEVKLRLAFGCRGTLLESIHDREQERKKL